MLYYNAHKETLITKFTDFKETNDGFEPDCLRGDHWEFVKLDMVDFVNGIDSK